MRKKRLRLKKEVKRNIIVWLITLSIAFITMIEFNNIIIDTLSKIICLVIIFKSYLTIKKDEELKKFFIDQK